MRRAWLRGWWGGAASGVSTALTIGAIGWLFSGGGPEVPVASQGSAGFSAAWLPSLKAEMGTGDYLFLPCRKEMWVINRAHGKVIHYDFKDNEQGTVKWTPVVIVDAGVFPPKDTEYAISDRNLSSYLWVTNRVTGDFQFLKATRESQIDKESQAIHAGEDLRRAPLQRERPANAPPGRRVGAEASR